MAWILPVTLAFMLLGLGQSDDLPTCQSVSECLNRNLLLVFFA